MPADILVEEDRILLNKLSTAVIKGLFRKFFKRKLYLQRFSFY